MTEHGMTQTDTMIDLMLPSPYRIERRMKDTHDTFTLELVPTDGSRGMRYEAGQFNMLYVFGAGEVPISISGDPTNGGPLVHTGRAVGSVTRLMAALRKGDCVGVRGPFGSHWPVAEAKQKDVLIVAGGIGLAPLRPLLCALLHRRDQFGRVVLLYGARTPDDILFKGELKRWRSNFDLDVQVTVDKATPHWRGDVGAVTSLIPRALFDAANALAMVCGPAIMMQFTVRALLERGMRERDLYISVERNMKCAVGFCGHCQFGPAFVCKDGPVFRFDTIADIFRIPEI